MQETQGLYVGRVEVSGMLNVRDAPDGAVIGKLAPGEEVDVLRDEGVGAIVFSPLAGGRLTGKYQHGIPADSRAGHDPRYLKPSMIDERLCRQTAALGEIAAARGQTTAQLALQWVLRDEIVTSALIGASRPE